MIVGVGQLTCRLFDIRSLKGKRKIVKSLIRRIDNSFNVSVGEVEMNDSYDWAVIGFSVVGNDSRKVNSKLDKIINLAENSGLAMIADSQIEIVSFKRDEYGASTEDFNM